MKKSSESFDNKFYLINGMEDLELYCKWVNTIYKRLIKNKAINDVKFDTIEDALLCTCILEAKTAVHLCVEKLHPLTNKRTVKDLEKFTNRAVLCELEEKYKTDADLEKDLPKTSFRMHLFN